MGYACPVCEDPQADAGHLANHLAFTAILGDDAHGAWLDDHVPGWGELDEAGLADALRDDVDETEFPQVFEDTVGGLSEDAESPAERSGALFEDPSETAADHGHDHGPGERRDGTARGGGARDAPDVAPVEPADPADEETAAILAEAREMTREMLGVDEPDADDGATDDGATDDGATDDVNGDGASDDDTSDDTPGDEPVADDGGEDHGGGHDPADADGAADGNENE